MPEPEGIGEDRGRHCGVSKWIWGGFARPSFEENEMFKSGGSGKAPKPSGGWGSHGKPKQPPMSKPTVTTDQIYAEQRIAGNVHMREALNVKCPKSQAHNNVTNRNGKAP